MWAGRQKLKQSELTKAIQQAPISSQNCKIYTNQPTRGPNYFSNSNEIPTPLLNNLKTNEFFKPGKTTV